MYRISFRRRLETEVKTPRAMTSRSIFSKSRHGRLRESDLLRKVFERIS
jgi:hypothetical protein